MTEITIEQAVKIAKETKVLETSTWDHFDCFPMCLDEAHLYAFAKTIQAQTCREVMEDLEQILGTWPVNGWNKDSIGEVINILKSQEQSKPVQPTKPPASSSEP